MSNEMFKDARIERDRRVNYDLNRQVLYAMKSTLTLTIAIECTKVLL